MTAVDIEKLNQLISRTDINGNDKVRWLTDFIDGRELQQQEQDKNNFSPDDVRDILKAIYKNKQQERSYSEEQAIEIFKQAQLCSVKADGVYFKYETFQQLKNK